MDIDNSPESESQTIQKDKDKRVMLGKVLCFFSLLMLLSIVGLSQTLVSILETFRDITLNGLGDPEIVADKISMALVHMLIYLFYAFPGWLCALIAIFFSSYRSKYYFVIWAISSIILIISVPFGSLFGFILALLLFFKRREFKKGN